MVDRERKPLRHDADDGRSGLSNFYRLPDRIVVPVEEPLPHLIAEQDDWRCVALFVGIEERAAEERGHACDPEG
jgi:hypothetical protein